MHEAADDTIWFWEGILRLLEEFDHNTPYIITGESTMQHAHCKLWLYVCDKLLTLVLRLALLSEDGAYWHNWGRPAAPNFDEDGPPRCLPCHFNQSGEQSF